MSCGDSHGHCAEYIERLYVFIDNELAEADHDTIQQHLDECGDCLKEYDLETTVRALIKKSCAETAPDELRQRVLWSIRQVQITITES
ncbi:MAG: mycothiol system anti-sigma-R factor [Nocardioidaceae bacterium]|nr:MAG: mycothiol system anti-sigma-R factor [Nocardioidaceae bacterium]